MADPTALDKLKRVVMIWCKMMSNIRMRDRTLKTLQYGCQMLLGFYGSQLSFMARNQMKALQYSASTSRKAFWLLKSIDQMGSAMTMFEEGYWQENSTMSQRLDLIEQFFLIWYFWCETLVFFARAKMFNLREHSLDYWCNWSWLGGDIAFFTARLLELRDNVMDRKLIGSQIEEGDSNSNSNINGVVELNTLKNELTRLENKTPRMQREFIIGFLELAVSLQYSGFYRFITAGKSLPESYVGAIGVASSAMIMYNGCCDAAELTDEDTEEGRKAEAKKDD